MLIAGAIVSMAGGLTIELAPSAPVVIGGLFVAALGVSVIAPSALSLAGRSAEPSRRGAAVATVGVIAYTGFFAGPAMLGFVAEAFELRTALATIVAVVALVIPTPILHRPFPAPPLCRSTKGRRRGGVGERF